MYTLGKAYLTISRCIRPVLAQFDPGFDRLSHIILPRPRRGRTLGARGAGRGARTARTAMLPSDAGPPYPPPPSHEIRDAAERVTSCGKDRSQGDRYDVTHACDKERVILGIAWCGTRMKSSNMILPNVACDEKRMTHRWDSACEKDARIAWSGIA